MTNLNRISLSLSINNEGSIYVHVCMCMSVMCARVFVILIEVFLSVYECHMCACSCVWEHVWVCRYICVHISEDKDIH